MLDVKEQKCNIYLFIFCFFFSQTRFSFKNVAILVGRISLLGMSQLNIKHKSITLTNLTKSISLSFHVILFHILACDFLGERLAGALGLNAAKYQYAIDQYQHDHKVMEGLMENSAATKQVF